MTDQLDHASDDAATRAVNAHAAVTYHQEQQAEASRVRREALTELADAGWSYTALAKLLGMTRSRVGQLLSTGPRPERALLGYGNITVAIGGKWEANKTNPSAVVSAEALGAYHLIRDACAAHKLEATYEVVEPPGMVVLNRENLIVIGGPRILPLVGQVLEADTHLQIKQGSSRWYFYDVDQEKRYVSPSDSGEPTDYAYLGRLPRPDGRGTFLYLAGIHAMGALGAAHFLTTELTDLYAQVKTRRWSTLVACHYDSDTHEVNSTERITPIYFAD